MNTSVATLLLGIGLLFLSFGDLALASLPQDELESLFDAPCDRYGVPKTLALAIASQESGMRPWAMNIAGRSILHATKEEAISISQAALRTGLSFDIGVMQINAWWIRRYNLPLEVVLDPRGNVQLGVWILAQEIKRHGLNWRAVASYHTQLERNPERGRAYAAIVLRRLGVTAPKLVPVAQPPAAAPMLVKRFRYMVSNERVVVRQP
jgi:soluble lytic murein transglycosylase-like protein